MITDLLAPLVCHRFKTDERYRAGHIRVINPLPDTHIMGVHMPELKKLAKELARKEDAHLLLENFQKAFCSKRSQLCYEEYMVWGLIINSLKCPVEERLEWLKGYIPTMDNWGTCDTFCCNSKWAARIPKEELWIFLSPYFFSPNEFEVRFAVVMSMCHLLHKEWLPRIFSRLETIRYNDIHSDYQTEKKGKTQGTVPGNPPYYVRMAVAWLLATSLYKFPDETRTFVVNSTLTDDVKRLYVRKARESLRTRNVAAI